MQRTLDAAVEQFVETLITQQPEAIRCSINTSEFNQQIEVARSIWGYSAPSGPFWQDVAKIVHDFLDLSATRSGTLHLKIISNDACKKFHVDGHPLRLFTTYYGLDTEWLPEGAVNRSALGTKNEHIIKDVDGIQRLKTGHVAILKGELPHYTAFSPGTGIVHRSPKITTQNKQRVILGVWASCSVDL